MRPRPTVRLRLTLWYAAVLVICGALLLGASYALVDNNLNADPATVKALTNQRLGETGDGTPLPPASMEERLEVTREVQAELADDALSKLRVQYALALLAMALGSLALGWVLAGRALSPLSAITSTARRVSEDSLDQRIALDGPDDELKELADTFDTMLSRLDSAFATQHRFVANASHELRTPLAVIRTEVDVALADPDASAEELRAMAERVRDASDRSERLIESLLTLARSEASTPRQDPVDLAVAVELGLDGVASEWRERGLDIRRDLRHAPVRGDRRLLERLVANLVENAVRHNVQGGWIQLTTAPCEGGEGGWLCVENGGERIAPENAERLVEPFERGARHARGSGAGLGLSIVRSVAEVHGGESPGRGEGGRRPENRSSPSCPPPRIYQYLTNDWQHLRTVSSDQGTSADAWRQRAGRIGLGATLAASMAMFASALGGIASIDVNAGTGNAKPAATPPSYQARGVEAADRDCPDRDKDRKTSQS